MHDLRRLNGPSLQNQHYESTPILEDMIKLLLEEFVASVCRTNALLEAQSGVQQHVE